MWAPFFKKMLAMHDLRGPWVLWHNDRNRTTFRRRRKMSFLPFSAAISIGLKPYFVSLFACKKRAFHGLNNLNIEIRGSGWASKPIYKDVYYKWKRQDWWIFEIVKFDCSCSHQILSSSADAGWYPPQCLFVHRDRRGRSGHAASASSCWGTRNFQFVVAVQRVSN